MSRSDALREEAAELEARAVETFITIMTSDPPKGWRVALRDTGRHATYFAHRDGRRFMIEARPGERASVTRL